MNKNENLPLVSIIVPVYNKKIAHLEKCFSSLVGQSYDNCEIIIVDDGSTLDVENFCRSYATENNLKFYRKSHAGVSSARNFGLDRARGDYIMFVDSDDWIDKNCCKYCLSGGFSRQSDVIFFSYMKEYAKRREEVKIPDDLYSMPVVGSSCMKLYRRDLLSNIRFNENLENAEDVEFNFRVFKRVKTHTCEKKCFYYYRIVKDSAVRHFDRCAILKYEKTIDAIKKDIDSDNRGQFEAYISFLGIAFLILLLNYVYSSDNHAKKHSLKELLRRDFTKELFANMRSLRLSIDKKVLILASKYHLWFLVSFAVYLKKRMDSQ